MKANIIKAAEAPVARAYGNTLHFHLTGEHNGGAFTMFTDVTPPGGGPPPHFHTTGDEWWFVLEGRPEFFDGETWTPVAAGGSVFMPQHSLHAFRNAGDQPLRQIIHTSPSGFEAFFRDSEAEFQRPGGPDMKRIAGIGEQHGILFPTLEPAYAARRGRPTLAPVITQPGAGRTLRAFGEEVTVLLNGSQTGGRLTAFLERTPPGGGPPPHWHEREDEWFYVLEGCVSFFANNAWTDAHPGDAVFAPRHYVHTFKNNTDCATRMLIHTAPAGFEQFFAEAAEEFARPGGPDMSRAFALAGRYGIRFVQP
jgi:quercetin dioxygenase-like cupin family protein